LTFLILYLMAWPLLLFWSIGEQVWLCHMVLVHQKDYKDHAVWVYNHLLAVQEMIGSLWWRVLQVWDEEEIVLFPHRVLEDGWELFLVYNRSVLRSLRLIAPHWSNHKDRFFWCLVFWFLMVSCYDLLPNHVMIYRDCLFFCVNHQFLVLWDMCLSISVDLCHQVVIVLLWYMQILDEIFCHIRELLDVLWLYADPIIQDIIYNPSRLFKRESAT